jgi:hypothetical protein
MGRLVEQSYAVEPGAAWLNASPPVRFLNSCMLSGMALVLFMYSLSSVLYGYMPFLMVLEMEMTALHGVPCVLMAACCVFIGLAFALHIVQRHWSTASRSACNAMRGKCWWIATGCAVAAFLVEFFSVHWPHLLRPIALAPRAEWPLFPLPFVWSATAGFASDRFVAPMLGSMVVLVIIGVVLAKLFRSERAVLFLTAFAMCVVGAWFVGGAGMDYGVARIPGPSFSLENAKELAANPGDYNAWTFVALWTGMTSFALGVLLMAVALHAQSPHSGR